MRRFFGMMPSSEIGKERYFKDKDGYRIIIQAGVNGWTTVYSDSATDFRDITTSTEENFNEAYDIAVSRLGILTEIAN